MFSPQRRGWSGWSLTPKTAEKNASSGKGKSVAAADTTPPPLQNSLGENGGDAGGSVSEVEAWKRFRETEVLDEATGERKGREAFLQRIEKLESELYDYQYNMGLLLIEKKEWASKYDVLRQGLVEAEEILKREKAAHVIAISDIEKRDENLRKALGVEKQCVADLEKALHEMRAEQAEVKFTADQKLADVHALMANVEEKSLEAEAKLHSADARLAEISRKHSEYERKSQELAARESILRREQASLNLEKELQAEDLGRQRDDLRAWERSLREGQERLVESQNLLNQREKRANESDKVLKKKEKDLELMRETIERSNSCLKEKEEYINIRLTALAAKEKEADIRKEKLEKKEKDLTAIEEKLNERERVEIQKLLDDHNTVLDSKKLEFEMEMEKRRKSFDEELREKLASVEKEENEIRKKEERLHKREQALEKKIEKLKDEQKGLDVRSKALKQLEDANKTNQLQLEKKSRILDEETQKLLVSKADIEAERKAIEAEKLYLQSEKESLKVTEQERAELVELQSKLKQEIDDCRILKESLAKEREELRQEREKFEREWEVLDEKRAALLVEAKHVNDEKERLEKWKHNEEEKLKTEQMAARDHIQNELNELNLKKQASEDSVKHERSEVLDLLQQERADMARKLDVQKHELEINMQKRLEELENQFQKKLTEFNEQKDAELNHISSLRERAASEMQKMKMEQNRFEREKQEYVTHKNKLREDQHEIQNDIGTLHTLSRNLKDQREEFVKERERFLALVEQYKTCKNCGVPISESVLPCLQPLPEIVDPGNVLLPTLVDGSLDDLSKSKKMEMSPVGNGPQSANSSGRMSWLRTCTRKIFNFSPGNKLDDSTHAERSAEFDVQLNRAASYDELDDSFDTQGIQSDDHIVVDTERIESDNGTRNEVSEPTVPFVDAGNEEDSLPSLPENGTRLQVSKQKLQRRGKQKAVKRTRPVRAVVEESKSILKETSEKEDEFGKTKDSLLNNKECQGDSVHTDRITTSLGQKRNFVQTSKNAASDLDADSEAHSGSVSVGGRHKRRQTVAPGTVAADDKRYNFRRSTVAGAAAAAQAKSNQTRGTKTKRLPQSPVDEPPQSVPGEGEGTSKDEQARVDREEDQEMHMLYRSTTESIVEVHEISPQKVEVEKVQKNNSQVELSEQSRDEGEEVNGAEAVTKAAPEDEPCRTEEAENDSEDDESDSEKYNTSMGKKLWKFFTT